MKKLIILLLPVLLFAQKPTWKPLFDGSYSKTWATSESDTIYSDRITVKNTEEEIGLYSLFIYGTGTVNVSVKLQFYVKDPEVYSPVYHEVEGFTNGSSSKVTSFDLDDGFDARIDTHTWWMYNPDGFRLVFIRASNVQLTITYGGVRAL